MDGLGDGELETAAEMVAALEAGRIQADELVERSLRRAEAWQPALNAFSQIWAEQARTWARVHQGVPLAVKDLYDVAGFETTGCSALYAGRRAERDAPLIVSVRESTVFVGKTNQHELAAGGTNLVSACGRTGNPWDPARMTGGSSGGSAAAVAAGIVPWALGSDTGGSIRIPAAMCGTFGLKPTTGRFPIEGLMPLAPSMDCPGPIAGTAGDLALLYELMGGDPGIASRAATRVGVPDGYFAGPIHDETRACVQQVAAQLDGMGMAVEPVAGRGIEQARRLWMEVCTPEFADAHPAARTHRDRVDPSVLAWIDQGVAMTPEARGEAARKREAIRAWYLERLDRVDALLIPTTPYPAPRADQEEVALGTDGTVRVDHVGPGWITCTVNLADLPAVNLPAGRSREGLPIGVSLVGRPGAEQLLLGLASWWEEATEYRPARPPSRG